MHADSFLHFFFNETLNYTHWSYKVEIKHDLIEKYENNIFWRSSKYKTVPEIF